MPLAFTGPISNNPAHSYDLVTQEISQDPIPPGQPYNCNLQEQVLCTIELDQFGGPIPATIQEGAFQ